MNVTITNTSSSVINGYELNWALGAGESFGNGWNANFSNLGGNMTASNPAGHWNGRLGANGGTSSFGFQVSNNSAPIDAATAFTLNGVTCSTTP